MNYLKNKGDEVPCAGGRKRCAGRRKVPATVPALNLQHDDPNPKPISAMSFMTNFTALCFSFPKNTIGLVVPNLGSSTYFPRAISKLLHFPKIKLFK